MSTSSRQFQHSDGAKAHLIVRQSNPQEAEGSWYHGRQRMKAWTVLETKGTSGLQFPANALSLLSCLCWVSLVAQKVKNPSEEIQETWAEKIPWRRKWQPTPVFFPG